MFESIRKHSKIAMLVMFLLIIPSFVLVGIDSSYFSGGSPVVARVDGHDITQAEWDQAHRVESDRLRSQQPGIDGALLDSPQARYATLERLVRDRVLLVAANKMHLQPSNARLASALQEIPQIAALHRPDGSLDAEAYRKLVATQGMTPEGFEASMRHDLAVSQVLGGIMATSFATPAQVDVTLAPMFQQREIRIASFHPKDFVSKVQVIDADLENYYKAHVDQFKQAEQANVEYVVLDLDAVRSGIVLGEDDLKTYYKENVASWEERRASHILIAVDKDAPAVERAAAKERAEAILQQVRKAPESFAEVAKKNSQDTGSAKQGGDLGFFGRRAMVKPFEDAAYALDKNAISDVVASDFGYHIIKLVDIKVPSFEEKRADIESQLKQQQAQRKYAEVAEVFANTVYEQSDSLQHVVDKLKLKLHTATAVTRTPAAGSEGALANAKLLAALFSSDSVESKRNTEAVEIGPSQLASARITQYSPARTLSFEEARERVRSLFLAGKSAELARAAGEAKREEWAKNADAAKGSLTTAMVVSRQNPNDQPATLVEKVMGQDPSKLPSWIGVDLGAEGYVVAQVTRIVEGPPVPENVMAQRRQQYVQWWTNAEGLAYYELLKKRFKAQIKVPRPSLTPITES
ncbi:MAG: SurA N-terminal domain-containing protein [Giesbergeria sp.]